MTTVVSSDRIGFNRALISDMNALRAELILEESSGRGVEGFGLVLEVAWE